jgi:hypothetical protein
MVVQSLRRGFDVPLEVLDDVQDVGKCMVDLADAEKQFSGDDEEITSTELPSHRRFLDK